MFSNIPNFTFDNIFVPVFHSKIHNYAIIINLQQMSTKNIKNNKM